MVTMVIMIAESVVMMMVVKAYVLRESYVCMYVHARCVPVNITIDMMMAIMIMRCEKNATTNHFLPLTITDQGAILVFFKELYFLISNYYHITNYYYNCKWKIVTQ